MLLILLTALAILPNPTLCRNIHNIYPFVYLGERFFDADKLEVTWSFDHSSLPGANSSNSVCNDYLFYYQIQKALLVWARHININFKYIEYDPKETEIYIRFGTGKHNCACKDCEGFDGRNDFTGKPNSGSLMAHAFPASPIRRNKPYYKQNSYNLNQGELHIDRDEDWNFVDKVEHDPNSKNTQIHIMYTLIHELGHVLGLDHVENRDSIMHWASPYSIYEMNHRVDVEFPELNDYDIKFISSLYGKRPPRMRLPIAELYKNDRINGTNVLVDPWNPKFKSSNRNREIDLKSTRCNIESGAGFSKKFKNVWILLLFLSVIL